MGWQHALQQGPPKGQGRKEEHAGIPMRISSFSQARSGVHRFYASDLLVKSLEAIKEEQRQSIF
eukprot:1158712-Pelagomonas_calceolata.AAC.9